MRISDWSSDVCSSDLHRLGKKQGVGKQKFGHGGLWVGSMLENRVVARQNRFCSYGRQVQQPVTFFDLCCAANQLAYTSQAEKKRFLAIWTIKRLGDSAMNKMHRAGLALVLAACAMPALAQESEQEMRPYVDRKS